MVTFTQTYLLLSFFFFFYRMDVRPGPISTPVKVKEGQCFVCGNEKYEKHRAVRLGEKSKSKDGMELQQLLEKYCDINVRDGTICYVCKSQLKRLNNIHVDLKAKIERTHTTLRRKRLAGTPQRPSGPSQPPPPVTPTTHISSTGAIPKRPGGRPRASSPVKQLFAPQILPKSSKSTRSKQTASDISSQISSSFDVGVTGLKKTEKEKLIETVKEGSTRNVTEVIATDLGGKFLPELTKHLTEACDSKYPKSTNKPSVLRKPPEVKTLDFLSSFKWEEICQEAFSLFPLLVSMMVSIMLPKEKWGRREAVHDILPRLGMVYAILIQTRVPQLSLVQRVITSLLMDSICETKVKICTAPKYVFKYFVKYHYTNYILCCHWSLKHFIVKLLTMSYNKLVEVEKFSLMFTLHLIVISDLTHQWSMVVVSSTVRV